MKSILRFLVMSLCWSALPTLAQTASQPSRNQAFIKLGQSSTQSEIFQDKSHPYGGIDMRFLPVSLFDGTVRQTLGFEVGASRQQLTPHNQVFSDEDTKLAMSYWAIKANFCFGEQLPVALCWGIHFNHRRLTGDGQTWAMPGSSQDLALQFEPVDGWFVHLGKDVGDSYQMKFKGVDIKASDRRYFVGLGKEF